MSINSCANYSYDFSINLEALEKNILKIQKEIYLAAKTYAINRVYEYQNVFFTRKELIFVVIEKVFLSLCKKYQLAKAYHRKLTLMMYFKVVEKRKTQSSILHFVKSKIVEYSILLLIKPEWEARCEKSSCVKQNDNYIQMTSSFANVFFQQFNCCNAFSSAKIKTQVNWENLDGSCLIKKIVCSTYLFDKLSLWLKRYKYTFEKVNFNDLFNDLVLQSELYSFFRIILYIGLEWHLYTSLKLQFIFRYLCLFNKMSHLYCVSTTEIINDVVKYAADFLRTTNVNMRFLKCNIYMYVNSFIYLNGIDLVCKNKRFIFRPSQKSIKQIFLTVRRKLYHKNYQGCQRINSCLESSKALSFINRTLYQWQSHYWFILGKMDILQVHKATERIFYIWQVKK